jgi:hypothetical protein
MGGKTIARGQVNFPDRSLARVRLVYFTLRGSMEPTEQENVDVDVKKSRCSKF